MSKQPGAPPPDPIPEDVTELEPLSELRTGPPPTPIPQAMASRYKGAYNEPRTLLRLHLLGHAAAFFFISLTMLTLPERYTVENLPSFTFALAEVPLPLWAVFFAIVATLKLIAYWKYPQLSRVGVSLGLGLVTMLTVLFGAALVWGDAAPFLFTFAALDVGGHVYAIWQIDGRRRWSDTSS